MLTQLNREFPTVSLLDIGAILKQVGQVLEQVSRALEVMVVLVTLCGMLLLLAQVQVGMRQRHQELVVWRTLGAGKKLLRTTLWCEFAMLGLVSGLVAAIGAETALAVLQINVLISPGSRTGVYGSHCRSAARYCFPYAAAGLAFVC
ncbi:sugar ABC transporter permease [Salmonella enterica]|nr:sugar ABC transporter permease [Salmonella enterica]